MSEKVYPFSFKSLVASEQATMQLAKELYVDRVSIGVSKHDNMKTAKMCMNAAIGFYEFMAGVTRTERVDRTAAQIQDDLATLEIQYQSRPPTRLE